MSTQLELQTLFEDLLLSSRRTSLTSDVSNTLITSFLNQAIRKETLRMRPQELETVTPKTFAITENTSQVAIPNEFLNIDSVYYRHTPDFVQQVFARQFTPLVQSPGVSNFFNPSQVGIPNHYWFASDTLLFDRYFNRTEADQIFVYGLQSPTTLSVDLPDEESGLSDVYDMLIMYRAGMYFYQRDEDPTMLGQYAGLLRQEQRDLWQDRQTPPRRARVELDKRYFLPHGNVNFNNPEVFFTS
jgi:hypothetical protein